RRQTTGQAAQCRRLARAVGAEQGHDLPLVDFQGDPLQHLNGAIAGPQVFDTQQTGHHATSSLTRYAAMTRGSARTSAGVPSAILTPWSSTAIRSEIPMTTFMWCSINSTVTPEARISRIRSVSVAASDGFIPAAGSS